MAAHAHASGQTAEEPTIALFAEHEARALAAGVRRAPLPVLLVSGALGAGKTTLLNHILHNRLNLRVTCVVNDFASLSVDAEMLLHRDEARKTVTLSNGCACHALGGRFEDEMWELLQEERGAERTDYVVVETSGIADPVRLVQSLERKYGKMTRARLDGVAVLVDADHLASQLADADDAEGDDAEAAARRRLTRAAGDAFWRQVVCADVILLNKVDLLATGAEGSLRALLLAAAPWARVHSCTRGNVPLPLLLSLEYQHFGGAPGVAGHESRLLKGAGGSYLAADGAAPKTSARLERLSTAAVPEWAADGAHEGFSSVEFTSDSPLRLSAFQDLMAAAGGESDGLQHLRGLLRRVLRVKGVVWFEEARRERFVLHVSGRQRVDLRHEGAWASRPSVGLVFIGGIGKPARRLRGCWMGWSCGRRRTAPMPARRAPTTTGRRRSRARSRWCSATAGSSWWASARPTPSCPPATLSSLTERTAARRSARGRRRRRSTSTWHVLSSARRSTSSSWAPRSTG